MPIHHLRYACRRDDPYEEHDLGGNPGHRGMRSDCEAALRAILNPEAVNRQAFSDQARRIKALGGRETILRMTGQAFGVTPLGGESAANQPGTR